MDTHRRSGVHQLRLSDNEAGGLQSVEPAPVAPSGAAATSWPTLAGSNTRRGSTGLSMPVNLGAPMHLAWQEALNIDGGASAAAGAVPLTTCASGIVADANGLVFVLCAVPIGGDTSAPASMQQPVVLCFDVVSSTGGPKLVWRQPLDAVALESDPNAPLSGALALTFDDTWLVVSTRVAVYAFLAPLGTPVWRYAADPSLTIAAVAPGLLVTAPGSDGNVRVVAAVNEGLVCLVNGKPLWSFQPALPSTSVGATVRVSAPALDDTDGDTIVYAFTDSSTSATTMRAVSLATGTLKWSQSFVLPLWMLPAVRTATAQQAAPVLSGGRAFLSVLGRALVVVDVASGTVVSDGTGLLSGSRVSVGVAPVLSPNSNAPQPLRSTNGNSSTSKGADNPYLLVSVCTEALADPATGSPAAPPPNGRTFQLCVHTADGAALPVDGQYNLGCTDAAGRFHGMSALAQPVLALGNRVSMPRRCQRQSDHRRRSCGSQLGLRGGCARPQHRLVAVELPIPFSDARHRRLRARCAAHPGHSRAAVSPAGYRHRRSCGQENRHGPRTESVFAPGARRQSEPSRVNCAATAHCFSLHRLRLSASPENDADNS